MQFDLRLKWCHQDCFSVSLSSSIPGLRSLCVLPLFSDQFWFYGDKTEAVAEVSNSVKVQVPWEKRAIFPFSQNSIKFLRFIPVWIGSCYTFILAQIILWPGDWTFVGRLMYSTFCSWWWNSPWITWTESGSQRLMNIEWLKEHVSTIQPLDFCLRAGSSSPNPTKILRSSSEKLLKRT